MTSENLMETINIILIIWEYNKQQLNVVFDSKIQFKSY